MKMFITLDVSDSMPLADHSRVADMASNALQHAMKVLAATGVLAVPLHVRTASDEKYAAMEKVWRGAPIT